MARTKSWTPNEEQTAALVEYAAAHGKDWKRELVADWLAARTRGTLHQIRNEADWIWLFDWTPPKTTTFEPDCVACRHPGKPDCGHACYPGR